MYWQRREEITEGSGLSRPFLLPTAHHLFVMEHLEAARRRYSHLYPDRPIKRVGDTQDAFYYLVLMGDAWANGHPLTALEIEAVEAMTPAGMFS